MQNVGITNGSTTVCQGIWEIYGDHVGVTIDTNGKTCTGSAMSNNCRVTFSPRPCTQIKLVAVSDPNNATGCCGGSNPDAMITAVSAW